MIVEVLEPPACEPVALVEAYDQLRLGINLTSHPDDRYLRRLIRTARQLVEAWTGRTLIRQKLKITPDLRRTSSQWGGCERYGWPAGGELPRPPLLEVVAVQYFDVDDVLRSVDTSSYRVIGAGASMGGRIEFVDGYTPADVFPRSDACSVTVWAGYPVLVSDDPDLSDDDKLRANVPEPLRDAVLLMVDQAYNARQPADDMVVDARVDALIHTFRIQEP